MTLTEVGKKIADHLARMEEGQLLPTHGELPVLFKAYAWRAGNRVKVRYKSFWNPSSLTRVEAEAYLAWLDAGDHGTHFDWTLSLPKARDRQVAATDEAKVNGDSRAEELATVAPLRRYDALKC